MGHLLDARREGIAVRWTKHGECLQHHQVERPLKDVQFSTFVRHSNGVYLLQFGCQMKLPARPASGARRGERHRIRRLDRITALRADWRVLRERLPVSRLSSFRLAFESYSGGPARRGCVLTLPTSLEMRQLPPQSSRNCE